MKILVTGGAGFIGSHFVDLCVEKGHTVSVLDSLTYAGNLDNLNGVVNKINFYKGDIRDLSNFVIDSERPDAVVNFAAESHVDRSITGPQAFLETNVYGTYNLLTQTLKYKKDTNKDVRFLQVSTDEVYGALGPYGKFSEQSQYSPRSPYSASKAAADHFVNAWHHTYGLDTIITNCSNNYGPRQYPEKLIPNTITKALANQDIPVYNRGLNVRDWIHVKDHCNGIYLALTKGISGETYMFGGNAEKTNIDIVNNICYYLDNLVPKEGKYQDKIKYVEDRLGHDFRYAVNDSKAVEKLGFKREYNDLGTGLLETVKWYVEQRNTK